VTDSEDFTTMDDPAFLAERSRVREAIEALQDRYEALTEEFDRRARAKWSEASLATRRLPPVGPGPANPQPRLRSLDDAR
jgi:hypothetical protein